MASNPNRKKTMPDGKVYKYTLSESALEKERQAHMNWVKEHYYRLYVYAPKEMKDRISALAKKHGVSISTLVVGILEKELEKEGL